VTWLVAGWLVDLGGKRRDFGFFGEQAVERLGHDLLGAAAGDRRGETQGEMAIGIEPQSESSAAALFAGAAARRGGLFGIGR